ncbi:hypothetical protein FKM82_024992 [Ascaphus truei]
MGADGQDCSPTMPALPQVEVTCSSCISGKSSLGSVIFIYNTNKNSLFSPPPPSPTLSKCPIVLRLPGSVLLCIHWDKRWILPQSFPVYEILCIPWLVSTWMGSHVPAHMYPVPPGIGYIGTCIPAAQPVTLMICITAPV